MVTRAATTTSAMLSVIAALRYSAFSTLLASARRTTERLDGSLWPHSGQWSILRPTIE
ncbi:MAG: hypothetical protein ACKVZJ_01595 [Phycisphaerales bacterium]